MKNLKFIVTSLIVFALLFQSCDDNLEEVDVPNFAVTPITIAAKAGEPIEFKVENAPSFLNFYSGEFEHEYKHRNRTNAEGMLAMSFLNAQKWGVGTNATGTLSVWTSLDYDGSGTAEAVASATWTDISDRFNIATAYSFAWTESVNVDITDLAKGKPIYFAFKFYAEDHKGNGNRQPEWRFDDFVITMDVDGAPAPLTVANMGSPGWNPVDVQGVIDAWNASKWYFTNGYWRFRGQPATYVNEDWLITNAINLTGVSPDTGKPLKTYSTALESFTHTYAVAGTYTVTLVGNNTTVHGSKETIQEFNITVTE